MRIKMYKRVFLALTASFLSLLFSPVWAGTYEYDAYGNLISEVDDFGNTAIYTYNAKNLLSKVDRVLDNVPITINYAYNPDGIRISKSVNGMKTRYIIDSHRDYPVVIAETDDSGNIKAEYVYGDGIELINIYLPETKERIYYHSDGLGSIRVLTDINGNIVAQYAYDATGNLQAESGSVDNNFLYTGQQYDSETGLYYLRARYLNPLTNRFTQQDAWMGVDEKPITLNKYAYADSDPVNGTDPSGHMTLGQTSASGTVQGILTTTARATVKVYSGPNAGKKVVKLSKQVGCYMGKQFVNRKKDRVEGHHPLQQSIGGSKDEQVLIYTARKTHQMLHTVQNMLFREKGLPPINKGGAYFEQLFSNNPGTRRLAFETAVAAARKVDKFCGYKGKKSFEQNIRREIKRWLKTNRL